MKSIIFAAALLSASTSYADDPKLPNGYTCDDVRRTVAEIGRVRAIALALENGLSLRQIYQIRHACRV